MSMDINEVYSGDLLKAADLKGREHTLCIASVEKKKYDNGDKLVVSFQNAKKKFVLNRTNAKRIAFVHGNNTDGWTGKEIVLYPDLVEFQGQTVEAIRVRPAAARGAPTNGVSVAGGQTVEKRPGYELSSGVPADKHPNAPGNDLDDPIGF